jgi:DNA-binding PadR family transcriptional regulator
MWILSMLNTSPKTGAEIMDAIEEMSQGWWRPSPGSIYPLLSELEKEGYVKKLEDGRYELTPKSKDELQWPPWMMGQRQQKVDEMLNEMNGFASYFEDLSKTDRKKLEEHMDEVAKLRDRLSALVQEGAVKP